MSTLSQLLAIASLLALSIPPTPQQGVGRTTHRGAAEFADAVGGTLSTGTGATLVPRYKMPANANNPTANAWAMTLTKTSTGWNEDFVLGLPSSPSAGPVPVLVLWHQWSASEEDTWVNTEYFELAAQRGWYVIAPLGAHELHLGIDYAQRNTTELIEFMAQFVAGLPGYPSIDNTRVYGVGFSMGGGALLSHACRNLDPTGFPYAAVVNHTGTMSAARGWRDLPAPPPFNAFTEIRNHKYMFGRPDRNAFGYQIASSIHLWPREDTVDPTSDLLRNIPALHVQTITFVGDTNDNVDQCAIACAHAASLGHVRFQCPPPLPAVGACSPHSWCHLNELQTLFWLEAFTFDMPSSRTRILADREARYYHITPTPSAEGRLCPFEYELLSPSHLLLRTSPEIARLRVHSASMGLLTLPTNVLIVDIEGPPNQGTTPVPLVLEITDYLTAPTLLYRNGVPQAQGPNTWSWNAGVLTIHEPDARAGPQWLIL
jgi:poly(3-hydroxybutyrate) depolymerase